MRQLTKPYGTPADKLRQRRAKINPPYGAIVSLADYIRRPFVGNLIPWAVGIGAHALLSYAPHWVWPDALTNGASLATPVASAIGGVTYIVLNWHRPAIRKALSTWRVGLLAGMVVLLNANAWSTALNGGEMTDAALTGAGIVASVTSFLWMFLFHYKE